jgi:hypothetical protein
LKRTAKKPSATRGDTTSSEYIRELIREDQKKKLQQRLSLLLLEGMQSGEPVAADARLLECETATAERGFMKPVRLTPRADAPDSRGKGSVEWKARRRTARIQPL